MSTSKTRTATPLCRMAAIAGILLIGIACFGFANVGQAHAQITKVRVNHMDATEGEVVDCAGGTAYYSDSSKTLYLNNATIDENYGFANVTITGNSNDTVTIELSGENTITYNGSGFGTNIDSSPSIIFTGDGSLSMSNANNGVKSGADITINGGRFSIDAGNNAFSCKRFTMNSGWLESVAGGSYAVNAKTMKNQPSQLGYINGKLAPGAKFIKGKNSYTVTNTNRVTLTKFGASKANAKINTVDYGFTYNVNVIGAKAFAKSKVKKVTLGKEVHEVKRQAFFKTASLKRLNLMNYPSTYSNWSSITFQSKALTKAGVRSGRGLTVKIETTSGADSMKAKLRAAGLNRYARVKTNASRISVASAQDGAVQTSATPLAAASF